MDVGAQGKITLPGAAPKYDYTFDLRVIYAISSLATRQGHRRCLLLMITRPERMEAILLHDNVQPKGA